MRAVWGPAMFLVGCGSGDGSLTYPWRGYGPYERYDTIHIAITERELILFAITWRKKWK